jgi:polysaccharide biosynthesis/export protein
MEENMDMGMAMMKSKTRLKKIGLKLVRFVCVCAALCAVVAQAQDTKRIPISMEDILRQQANPPGNSQDLNERLRAMTGAVRFSQDYLLGPGDVISITVFGIQDLNQKELMLDSEGKISLPFIDGLGLMGLTPGEAEVKIATLYEASVMKNPQVSVSVKEYRSQFVNVLGAVYKPGTYQLTRRSFLVDVLAMAGGLMPDKADTKILIHRAGSASSLAEAVAGAATKQTLEIDLLQLLDEGDVSLNVPLYAGDVIAVPERVDHFYYVLGDVIRGGAFQIKKGESITLTKALASAGGLMPTAKAGKCAVIRQTDSGSTEQIPIDVRKLLKGQSKDIALSQNDVVFVPGSTTKTVGRGLMNSISGVLSSLVYIGARY